MKGSATDRRLWRRLAGWLFGFVRRHPHPWILIAVVAATALSYFTIDRPIAGLVHGFPAFDKRMMDAMARIGRADAYLVIVVLVLAVSWFVKRRTVRQRVRQGATKAWNVSLFLLSSIAITGLTGIAMKIGLGRMRPRELYEHGLYGFSPFNVAHFGMNSLPSGHTQFMFTLAMALTLVYPRYDAFYFFFAIAIGLLRVLEGAHYVSDVILGAYIGVMGPLLIKKYLFDARGLSVRIALQRDRRLAAAIQATLASEQGAAEVAGDERPGGQEVVDEG